MQNGTFVLSYPTWLGADSVLARMTRYVSRCCGKFMNVMNGVCGVCGILPFHAALAAGNASRSKVSRKTLTLLLGCPVDIFLAATTWIGETAAFTGNMYMGRFCFPHIFSLRDCVGRALRSNVDAIQG